MESTLNLKKGELESKLGFQFGFGVGSAAGGAAWNAKQSFQITDCLESGLRRVYHCGYNWSWLKPFKDLTLTSGNTTLELPEDFGGIEGDIALADSASDPFKPVKLTNAGTVQQLYASAPTSTGRPQFMSLRQVTRPDNYKSNRQELYIFPESDATYTVRIQYYLLPNMLDGTHQFAYGGSSLTETILESCHAVKEERYDNVVNGPHAQAFARLLSQSIRMDARNKAQWYGETADRSDDVFRGRSFELGPFLINGVDES